MNAPPVLPIALIDDQALFRDILAEMIDQLGGYKVVVVAANGQEYIEAMRNGPSVAVAIVDLHMPVMDGYATLEWIRRNTPGTRALALTFEKTEEAMLRALRAGACGFLLKDVTKSVFRDALAQVATLGHYHSDLWVNTLPTADPKAYYERERAEVLATLSDRELTFVRWVCDEAEFTYEQIAERMGVHPRTVDGYRCSVFDKFGLKSKVGLVIFAYRWGLVDPFPSEAGSAVQHAALSDG